MCTSTCTSSTTKWRAASRSSTGSWTSSRPKQQLRERVDLNEVVDRTLQLLEHHVRFKRLTVTCELAPNLRKVPKASGEQLVQVFMALLLNAMDAMADRRGAITIRRARDPARQRASSPR